MTKELQEFLEFYLPGQGLAPLLDKFRETRIGKGELLLRPGMNCSFLAFIQQGTFRVYYYDIRGKEIITWFSFEGMAITDMLGFYTTGRATFYVEAMENCCLYRVAKADLERLYDEYPEYRRFGQLFAEEALTMLMKRTMSLHTKSAEERYLELLQTPEYLQKIPLKYLASYLGVTDTSLSRIRRSLT